MENLVSGMILVEKDFGDLHWLVITPEGWKAIDTGACCIEFEPSNYTKAYIPKDYNDPWTPADGTEIMLTEAEQ
ncbi:hypothetical protein [Clostridium magnum]|uniref:Uncharacterized protein n=1 Tax=Clostridium magnum DSM 2767 TaxID=1121326 RepID=A0A161X4D5_9CLOT|nr:hypothetical protein [Clostridium magnum]KZL88736.1 hypothetical protein CLMAG_60250 [Clostridium magnum DSM 2767]SHJ61883.1 hypothetical protein SAMN02745944_06245 [Clostridium magnum DSM 2767]